MKTLKIIKMYKSMLTVVAIIVVCSTGFSQNLVSSQSWTISSGSVGIFLQNGVDTQNVREMGTNPFGGQAILWKAVADAANAGDGGWDTNSFPIDNTKMYRYAVWIKKSNSADGTTYFGCSSNNVLDLSGTVNSNAYFWAGDLPQLDRWYLLVGYIHASSDASTTSYGGIYDGVTGAKVVSTTDFKFSASATTANHRTYLYYDQTTSDRQYFYGPEVYKVDQQVTETFLPNMTSGNAFFGGNVGIGTTTPGAKLHVSGSGNVEPIIEANDNSNASVLFKSNGKTWQWSKRTSAESDMMQLNYHNGTAWQPSAVSILTSGNVGIGTTSPQSLLHLNSTVDARKTLRIYWNSDLTKYLNVWQGTGGAALDPIGTGKLYLGYDQTTDTYVNGKLGIGTTSPDFPLTVNGSIHAKEVRVDLTGALSVPDYVFEKDYKLPSLEDIKTYIDQNKHLPEVPSANEIEKNGVQLGEMNLILLKKIEELTLYVIELKKENEAQNKMIDELKKNK